MIHFRRRWPGSYVGHAADGTRISLVQARENTFWEVRVGGSGAQDKGHTVVQRAKTMREARLYALDKYDPQSKIFPRQPDTP